MLGIYTDMDGKMRYEWKIKWLQQRVEFKDNPEIKEKNAWPILLKFHFSNQKCCSIVCMAPTYCNAFLTMSGHIPNVTTDGVLEDLLLDSTHIWPTIGSMISSQYPLAVRVSLPSLHKYAASLTNDKHDNSDILWQMPFRLHSQHKTH